ncbi:MULTISPECIES: co-regulatory protein PtrA N-terminal domain-containing protein [unclassified Pseudomonas]|uniref:co-regulatory protein PtrA N-terminal domain-containing protein n=1 Tax=unclassified Pseudomonas TaxID=196821 RepID=UPI0010FA4A61|nr:MULTISPECIES: co-regulatory protein PtrA N-terminal domain-containing protein [unclassified Pseudomonas]
MKYLRLLLIVGSTLLSSILWAEGGSDRAIERAASMHDKAALVVKIEQRGATAASRVEEQPACSPAR